MERFNLHCRDVSKCLLCCRIGSLFFIILNQIFTSLAGIELFIRERIFLMYVFEYSSSFVFLMFNDTSAPVGSLVPGTVVIKQIQVFFIAINNSCYFITKLINYLIKI